TSGTYTNNPINLAGLYGGNWFLGGVPTGAYDARYTAPTLGAGAGNVYRLGGGGNAIVLGQNTANAAQNNVLTGANAVQIGFDSGNVLPANATAFQVVLGGTNDFTGATVIHRGAVARLFAAPGGTGQTGLSTGA